MLCDLKPDGKKAIDQFQLVSHLHRFENLMHDDNFLDLARMYRHVIDYIRIGERLDLSFISVILYFIWIFCSMPPFSDGTYIEKGSNAVA